MTNQEGLFLQPIYFPLAEFARQRNNTALDVWVASPTYRIQNRPAQVKYLDVSATYNPGTRELFVNVLNRSRDKDITAAIESQHGAFDGSVAVWELNHPDLKATHTFGDDRKVRPVTRTVRPAMRNGEFSHTFPAHSLTILTAKLTADR
jgi:alpha-N-arabinofuranosidase